MKKIFYFLVLLIFAAGSVHAEQPFDITALDHLRVREDYSEATHKLRLVFDNGDGEDSNDLNNVTLRYLLYVTLAEDGPAAGEPILIEEKQWDPATGNETLTRSVVNTYSEQGELLHSDLFSGDGVFQMRLIFEKQEHGIEIKMIHPDGHIVPINDFMDENLLKAWTATLEQDSHGRLTFNKMDSLSDLGDQGVEWLNFFAGSIHHAIKRLRHELKHVIDQERHLEDDVYQIIGRTFFVLAGYYGDKSERGVVGQGEVSDKVRITHINGILNTKQDELMAAAMVSSCHGGANVHYTYRASHGWTQDCFKVTLVRLGYTSAEAFELASSWRALIGEMGGSGKGGMIIHYAHSIGAAETLAAKQFLTPEEQQMIVVRTFGAPKLIGPDEFYDVVNYVSYRDGVCLFDPITYVQALLGYGSNVVFVGSYLGMPGVDHFFEGETYRTIIEGHGREFVESYGSMD